MSGRKAAGVTRQHADALSEIIAWAGTHPETTPLELGVLEEMRERLMRHAKDAAIVRVRIKNLGTPPSERARRHAATVRRTVSGAEVPTKAVRLDAPGGWTADELATLDRLWREGVRVADIADRVGRSESATSAQIERLHYFGTRAKPMPHLVRYNTGGPLLRAKAVFAERKWREARARRDGLEVAS